MAVPGATTPGRYRSRPARRAKQSVFERDGFRCVGCGGSFPAPEPGVAWGRAMGNHLTVDHVVPRSKGGANAQWNLVTMCYDCNHAKGDRVGSRLTVKVGAFV